MGEALSFLLVQGHSDRTLAPNAPPRRPQASKQKPIGLSQTSRPRATPPCRERSAGRSPPCFRQSRWQRRHKPKTFCAGLFAWSFAKTAGALAALARHPLVAEPILYGARLLAAPLSGIGVRIPRARGAMCPGRESFDCCAPQ